MFNIHFERIRGRFGIVGREVKFDDFSFSFVCEISIPECSIDDEQNLAEIRAFRY